MEGRKQFTFYRSYYQALMQLPKCHRLRLVEAILAYGLDRKEPEGLNGIQSAAFILISPTLEAGWSKSEAGLLGAMKTNGARKTASAKPRQNSGSASATQRDASGEREKEKEKEKENENETESEGADAPLEPGFERFWELYPVKVGKDAALAAYRETKPDDDTLCRNLNFWLSSRQWKRENGRFIPRPAKFIRERHFDHIPPDCVPTGGTGYMGEAELEAIERILRDQ